MTIGANDAYIYKERVGRMWEKKIAAPENVFLLHPYYRKNKSYPGLKMMVARIRKVKEETWNSFTAVIYTREEDTADEDIDESTTGSHGNSKRVELLSQPYYRTSKSVLNRIDNLLEKENPSSVFATVLEESGGPFNSQSILKEARNCKQVLNRKNRLQTPRDKDPAPKSNLDKLLPAQRDPNSLVRSVLVYEDAYIYSDKQLQDIEKFCCKDTETSVLGIDTTFKLCDMWLTDTSYRNQRLLATRSNKHPVVLGPAMLHFTKDETTFQRFCLELLWANPGLNKIKKVGADMESAIFNGFKGAISDLLKLYCICHLRQRDRHHQIAR